MDRQIANDDDDEDGNGNGNDEVDDDYGSDGGGGCVPRSRVVAPLFSARRVARRLYPLGRKIGRSRLATSGPRTVNGARLARGAHGW